MPMWMLALASLAAGQLQVLALRRAAADEHRVEAARRAALHALDAAAERISAPMPIDVADLLVEHLAGQAERRDVRAHQAAGHCPTARRSRLRSRAAAGRWRPSARPDRRRCRPRACRSSSSGTSAAGPRCRPQVGRDALQPADRHRLVLDPAAPAGRLAGPVADAPEDAREDVGLAVQHVGVGVTALRDQPDVARGRRCGPGTPTGNRRPCGSSPDWWCRSAARGRVSFGFEAAEVRQLSASGVRATVAGHCLDADRFAWAAGAASA